MSFRVITVRLCGNHSDIAVLNGALVLSKLFDGHIDAIFTRPDTRSIAAAMTSDDMYPGTAEPLLAEIERHWANPSATLMITSRAGASTTTFGFPTGFPTS